MEFTLENINIFDKNIGNKFDILIKNDISLFEKNKFYKLEIYFSSELTYNDELRIFEDSVYNDIDNNKSQNDRLYEALRKQLGEFDIVLCNYGFNIVKLGINGRKMSRETVKISIEEFIPDKYLIDRKNKIKHKPFFISPDSEYIGKILNESINEKVSEGFQKVMGHFGDRELFCKTLELPITENEDELYNSFYKEYGDLYSWFASDERKKQIKDRLLVILDTKQKEIGLRNEEEGKGH